TAIRHRVRGVHDEVHEELFELSHVDLHGPELGCEVEVDRHALRDRPPKHRSELADDRVEMHILRIDGASMRECEELARECRTPLCRQADLNDVVAYRAVRWERVLDE